MPNMDLERHVSNEYDTTLFSAFRAPLCYEALNTKYGPAFNTKYSLKAGGRSEC